MSEKQGKPTRPYQHHEGVLSAVSVGAVFILIGLIFVITPGLWEKIVAFFNDFTTTQVPGTGIYLPAPAVPAAHAQLYTAVFQFSIGLVILEILLVAIRPIALSPTRRLAQEVVILSSGRYSLPDKHVSQRCDNFEHMVWVLGWNTYGSRLIVNRSSAGSLG